MVETTRMALAHTHTDPLHWHRYRVRVLYFHSLTLFRSFPSHSISFVYFHFQFHFQLTTLSCIFSACVVRLFFPAYASANVGVAAAAIVIVTTIPVLSNETHSILFFSVYVRVFSVAVKMCCYSSYLFRKGIYSG